jgi:general secretion pathway protein I
MKQRGFTLIEVVVAFVIVVLAVSALLGAVTSSASNTAFLRDKTFAEWVALNKLTETRVAGITPSRGVTTGELQYAGRRYQWQQSVTPLPFNGMFKIEVRTRLLADGASVPASVNAADADDATDWSGTAIGVISTSVAIARSPVVAWDEAPAGGGGPGPGGQGGQGGEGGQGAPAPNGPTPPTEAEPTG